MRFVLVLAVFLTSPLAPEEKALLGSVERLTLLPEGLVLDALIDTGAALSSLHARDIAIRSREGQELVCFTLSCRGRDVRMQRPLCSRVSVRQAGSFSCRPTVLLDVMLGEKTLRAEFTLADRSAMSRPVLIGRNILSGWALVDVSRSFLLAPHSPALSD